MPSLSEKFEQARQLEQEGDLAGSEASCRKILAIAPQHPETLHLLGLVLLRQGRNDEAIASLSAAAEAQPQNPFFYFNLAVALVSDDRFADAVAAYEESIRLKPDFAEAHFFLASVHNRRGRFEAAAQSLEAAVRIRPNYIDAWISLGHVLLQLGRPNEAARSCERALQLNPASAHAHFNLGIIRKAQGQLHAAEQCYRDAIRFDAAFAPARLNLGNLMFQSGRLCEAIECFQGLVELNPYSVDGWLGKGSAHYELGDYASARAAFEEACRVRPMEADGFANLGLTLRKLGAIEDSIAPLQEATDLSPTNALAHYQLGHSFAELGRFKEAGGAYSRAIALRPQNWLWRVRHASLCPQVFESVEKINEHRARLARRLEGLNDEPGEVALAELSTSGCEPSFNLAFCGLNDRPIREQYGRLFSKRIQGRRPRFGDGKPRIGMFVADGHERLFARQMAGAIRQFSPGVMQIAILVSHGGKSILAPLLEHPDIEYLVIPRDLAVAAAMIEDAKLDLLYFREIGTESVSYFLPYLRCAPIQCTTWGIQVTSGIPAVDYYLSSRLIEAADAQEHYSEKLVFFDTLLTCQQRRREPPKPRDRSYFGLAASDHVYLCAQQLGKFHPDFDSVLNAILERDRLGKLVITAGKSSYEVQRLRARFERVMPDVGSRIVFVPSLAQDDYLSLILASDVMLDPLFFNGVNTTYDGLSFGMPIVTLPWQFQRGQYTHGCYRKLGIDRCVASSRDDYVEIAVRLGTNPDERRGLDNEIIERGELLFNDAAVGPELESWLLDTIFKGRSSHGAD